MLRILNAEPERYNQTARQILLSFADLTEVECTRSQLLHLLPDFDVLIVRLGILVDQEVIDSGTCLKVIVTATTGLDHIDMTYAQSRNIHVLSLRGETEFLRSIPATAEHTWGLLLALVRYIPGASASVLTGRWQRDSFRGHDLCDKKLGILGLGRIGEKIARYGIAFNMEVVAYDPYRNDWLSNVHRCFTLQELLSTSEILSIHVPLNDETFKMIGRDELACLPPSAYLVNTARGSVVDEVALLDALQSGRLIGAALDVLDDERNMERCQNNALLAYARTHDNLLITPHIGGATIESMTKTEVFMAKKLKVFVESLQTCEEEK